MIEKLGALRTRLEPAALLFLRLVVGVVMIAHAYLKITEFDEWIGHLRHMGIPAPGFSIYVAIAGELFGGIGVLLGAFTPAAALAIAGSMTTAILFTHLKNGLFGKDGGFEYPLTMLATVLFLAMHGPGPWSVDGMRRRKATGDRKQATGNGQ